MNITASRTSAIALLVASAAAGTQGCQSSDSGAERDASTASADRSRGQPDPPGQPCQAKRLKLLPTSEDAAMGHRAITIPVRNEGASPCVLTGYPTVTMLDAAGKVVANLTVKQVDQSYLVPNRATSAILLQPKAHANVAVTYSVIDGPAGGCLEGKRLRIGFPDQSRSIGAVSANIRACGAELRVTPWKSAP